MKNVSAKVSPDGKSLTLVVDLTKEFGPSSSGKTTIIASSEGNQVATGDVKFGLNVYRPVPKG